MVNLRNCINYLSGINKHKYNMKSLNEYLLEGGLFNNIGAGDWEVDEEKIRDWLAKARIYVKDPDDLLIKGRDSHPLVNSRVLVSPGVNIAIKVVSKPELFPDGRWPEFMRFSCIERGVTVIDCGLVTLEGMPRVYDHLNISTNKLTTLEGYQYDEIFNIRTNVPALNASYNDLQSLKGCPKCSDLKVNHNQHLRSLRGMKSGRMLNSLSAENCDLRDLVGCPKLQKHTSLLSLCNNPDLDIENGLGKILSITEDIYLLAIDASHVKGFTNAYQNSIGSAYICNVDDSEFLRSDDFINFIKTFSKRRNMLYVRISGSVSYNDIREADLWANKEGFNVNIQQSTAFAGEK